MPCDDDEVSNVNDAIAIDIRIGFADLSNFACGDDEVLNVDFIIAIHIGSDPSDFPEFVALLGRFRFFKTLFILSIEFLDTIRLPSGSHLCQHSDFMFT